MNRIHANKFLYNLKLKLKKITKNNYFLRFCDMQRDMT